MMVDFFMVFQFPDCPALAHYFQWAASPNIKKCRLKKQCWFRWKTQESAAMPGGS